MHWSLLFFSEINLVSSCFILKVFGQMDGVSEAIIRHHIYLHLKSFQEKKFFFVVGVTSNQLLSSIQFLPKPNQLVQISTITTLTNVNYNRRVIFWANITFYSYKSLNQWVEWKTKPKQRVSSDQSLSNPQVGLLECGYRHPSPCRVLSLKTKQNLIKIRFIL